MVTESIVPARAISRHVCLYDSSGTWYIRIPGLRTIVAVPHRRIDDPAKLRRLMDAVLMVEADVELGILLGHLGQEACSLVDARYGALGVLNEARTGLDQFITVGLSEDQEQRDRTAPDRPRGPRTPYH